MKQVELLTKARDLIAKGYSRFRQGRNAQGKDCFPSSAEAVSWCALGAINAVDYYAPREIFEVLAAGIPKKFKAPAREQQHVDDANWYGADANSRIAAYNNYTDQKSVIRLFNKAIKKVEKNPV